MLAVSRVRVELVATQSVVLPAHPAAVLYATVAAAFARSRRGISAVPDGVLVDPVEIGRLALRPDDVYHFGITFLGLGPPDVADLVRELHDGLAKLGKAKVANRPVFGGNFRVQSVVDLATGQPFATTNFIRPLPGDLFHSEVAAAKLHARLTLRFTTPLATGRSKTAGHRVDGREHFDRDYFNPSLFLNRVRGRLLDLGVAAPEVDVLPTVSVNRLVWVDIPYGPTHRKRLGGAVGTVVLDGVSLAVAELLALGQYARVGESTRFGFGAYRLAELGPEPYAVGRAVSLVDIAAREHLDAAAADYDLPPTVARRLHESAIAGTYEPDDATFVEIPKANGHRRLAIPSRRDRAWQRAVTDAIAPPLDQFFEESAWAYRRGLCRSRTAAAIRRAVRDGFGFGVKADFTAFFDNVCHDELADRLDAYLGDARLTDLVRRWVAHGSTRGLPTGSPLSPVLANLYLDQFDERIAARGGRLVRYADDFLILTRSESEATDMLAAALEEAAALSLELNADKTRLLDLREPFEFLGFRFERLANDWLATGTLQPLAIGDLGWEESAKVPPPWQFPLPGEERTPSVARDGTAIFGPGLEAIRLVDGTLVADYSGRGVHPGLPLPDVEELVVLGRADWHGGALDALVARGIPVWFCDETGFPLSVCNGTESTDDPAVLAAQVRAVGQPDLRLAMVRPLIVAKLRNYAALAAAFPRTDGQPDDLSESLRTFAEQAAEATTIASLRGIEGAGAARWYGRFAHRLPYGFRFQRRIAPNASDPVNALLNLAQTVLHHHCILAARAAGLAPGLGLLHEYRSGHAALASDLQEPFRHLMDRCVLEACRWLQPGDFVRGEPLDTTYRLVIRPAAARKFRALLAQQFSQEVRRRDGATVKSVRGWLFTLARNVRHALLNPDQPVVPFEHAP